MRYAGTRSVPLRPQKAVYGRHPYKFPARIDNNRPAGPTLAANPRQFRTPAMSTNESAVSHRKVKESSDRSFGLVFATVFGLIGAWPWLFGREPRLWAFAAAALFLAAAFLFPRAL